MSENSSDTKTPRIVRVTVGGANFKADGTVEVVEEHEVKLTTRPADEGE
ncbi:MAG: hypothetical protein KDB68_01620 [Planctomycetes bacterium]|nr:hypothetical protein [Planctomycetota bacterium]MCA8934879.1 hypothetical protein [Planctomycetota bacterium]